MTGAGRPRPLLFLDVDGPLIPFGATRQQRPYGYPTYGEDSAHPLPARIDPSLGPLLAALPCALVWATTWRAAGRPFAWIDDEITDADRWWVAAHHPGPALLHRVDPAFGLTDADFTVLAAWLREVGRPDTSVSRVRA
ncbi:hypothetical protein AB0B01_18700 [Streptomyces sp. NPDC044571]|uniref:hypothetical protein n=1 Tax=Streptomyces sp. NPDC044571 TaxID=3155371 RepID=UPI0033E1A35B